MTSIEFYERDTVIKRIKDNLNQINHRYFEGTHGILSVTDNGDYVTIKNRGVYLADYDTQKLFDALENFGQDDYESRGCYDLWDYLDHCEYTLPENQETENELKTDDELSFSEKRQVALVDMLLGEPESSGTDNWTVSLIPQSPIHTEASTLSELVEELEQENKRLKESREFWRKLAFSGEDKYQECLKYIASGKTHLNKYIKQLQEEYQELKKENEQSFEQLTVLNETVTQLCIRVYKLEGENKQLKNNQLEVETKSEPKSKLEKKPTAKKQPKFKLPENFADYQQKCDDLISALSCFYSVKKGKWGKDILQFILIPTDTEKAKHPYPDKWKAGLYLQTGMWTIDKVNLSDPDEWEEWFMDIGDFADANDIEIS